MNRPFPSPGHTRTGAPFNPEAVSEAEHRARFGQFSVRLSPVEGEAPFLDAEPREGEGRHEFIKRLHAAGCPYTAAVRRWHYRAR